MTTATENFSLRRKTLQVKVGKVLIGGGLGGTAIAPVVVQSMTNTDTVDDFATAMQVAQLARAGSEIVRITVNTREAAAAVPKVRERLLKMNVDVPLVGDFHFNGHKLLTEFPECAQILDKLRINPGNVGKGAKRDEQYAQLIEIAAKYDKPVRIGVNWGSLDQALLARIMDENAKRAEPKDATAIMREAMVTSALESAAQAVEFGLSRDKIILSCKVSGVQELVAVYRERGALLAFPFLIVFTLVSLTESIAVVYNDFRWALFVALAGKLAFSDRHQQPG